MNIGYIRNSRISQENSVETQKNIIEEYCDKNQIKLNQIIIDEGISGSGEKVNDRTGYNNILKMIGDGKVDNSSEVLEINSSGIILTLQYNF